MELIFNGKVKTRKIHNCWGCTKEYPIGTMMSKTTTIDSGKIVHSYWCDICDKFWGTLDMYEQSEGYTYGELSEHEKYPKQA